MNKKLSQAALELKDQITRGLTYFEQLAEVCKKFDMVLGYAHHHYPSQDLLVTDPVTKDSYDFGLGYHMTKPGSKLSEDGKDWQGFIYYEDEAQEINPKLVACVKAVIEAMEARIELARTSVGN